MSQDTATITIRLPLDLKNRLALYCEQNDLTTSQVIRQMLKADYRLQAIKPPAPSKPNPPASHRPGNQQKRRK